jgi:uncharacterized coiled-coil protein SlyX
MSEEDDLRITDYCSLVTIFIPSEVVRLDENETKLLAGRLRHTLDLLNGRIDTLEARVTHEFEVTGLRLSSLEQRQTDHEERLRSLNETVVRLTTSAGLAQAAQVAFALILSAIAAWLGSQK